MTSRPSRLRNPRVALRRARLLPLWVRRLDERTATAINGGADSVVIDGGFRRLSRAADRGLIWFSIAGVLVLAGRRGAALRGVASLTAASILANLIGKQLFGGDRPLLDDVPLPRRLPKHPTSPSFPSGHSASAAAFATGVALESPSAGAVIAPLAAAVAYSRMHTGAHWLSDVVGGVALGSGVALAGRAVVGRLVPHRPIGSPGERVDLPASETGEGLFLVANARSGRFVGRRDPLRILARRLPNARVHTLRPGETPADAVRAALEQPDPPRILGVSGGDGTVSAMAHVARQAELPLLVIPGGTFNHFARAVGATTPDEAIDALQAGTGLAVDVAEAAVDDREYLTILNTAAIGLYPDFVAERERYEDAVTKWGATLVAAVRMLGSVRPVRIRLGDRHADAWSLFVAVDRNDPRLVSTMQRRGLADRILDVRVLHAGGSRVRATASLIFGRRTAAVLRALHLMPAPSRVESFTTTELDVTVRSGGRRPPRYAHDGEVDRPDSRAPRFRLRIRVVPQGLRVYTPGSGEDRG